MKPELNLLVWQWCSALCRCCSGAGGVQQSGFHGTYRQRKACRAHRLGRSANARAPNMLETWCFRRPGARLRKNQRAQDEKRHETGCWARDSSHQARRVR